MRLLLTRQSHVTYPQLLPRSPKGTGSQEITHCIEVKNLFCLMQSRKVPIYMWDMCIVLVTLRP